MKRVLTAVILIPIVVLALFKAPLWLFTLLVLGVALLAAREYLDIAQSYGLRPFRELDYLFMVCVFLVAYSSSSRGDRQQLCTTGGDGDYSGWSGGNAVGAGIAVHPDDRRNAAR